MQIEFINYTKDYTDEQSVFYFEDSTEALAWYDDYIEKYPDDETGCTYFSAYGVELTACVDMIKEYEELEKTRSKFEMEAMCQLIDYGYARTFEEASDRLENDCYIISGHGKLDAFENFLDDICYFDDVPDHIRDYVDIDGILRSWECGGMTMIELNESWDDYWIINY